MSSRQPNPSNSKTSQYDDLYDFAPAPAPAAAPNRLLKAMSERNLPPEEPARPKPNRRDGDPPPPALAFFIGVFSVPFYRMVLPGLLMTSLALCVSGTMAIFLLDQGFKVGMVAARPFGMGIFFFGILSLGYTFAVCRTIIENTSEGIEGIDEAPEFDWRGWALSFMFGGLVLAEAAAVGYLVQLLSFTGLQVIAPLVAFFVLPVMVLSAIHNDSPVVPIALPVLRSMASVWWAWCLFYLETGVMLLFWAGLVVAGIVLRHPYLTVFYAAPLLAAVVLIYARLLGRLAWCASLAEEDD
jgi:hypothetical protein